MLVGGDGDFFADEVFDLGFFAVGADDRQVGVVQTGVVGGAVAQLQAAQVVAVQAFQRALQAGAVQRPVGGGAAQATSTATLFAALYGDEAPLPLRACALDDVLTRVPLIARVPGGAPGVRVAANALHTRALIGQPTESKRPDAIGDGRTA